MPSREGIKKDVPDRQIKQPRQRRTVNLSSSRFRWLAEACEIVLIDRTSSTSYQFDTEELQVEGTDTCLFPRIDTLYSPLAQKTGKRPTVAAITGDRIFAAMTLLFDERSHSKNLQRKQVTPSETLKWFPFPPPEWETFTPPLTTVLR